MNLFYVPIFFYLIRATEEQLITKDMKEMQEKSKIDKYERVRFPGNVFLQFIVQ